MLERLARLRCTGNDVHVGTLSLDCFLGQVWHRLAVHVLRVRPVVWILEKLNVGDLSAAYGCLNLHVAEESVCDTPGVGAVFICSHSHAHLGCRHRRLGGRRRGCRRSGIFLPRKRSSRGRFRCCGGNLLVRRRRARQKNVYPEDEKEGNGE